MCNAVVVLVLSLHRLGCVQNHPLNDALPSVEPLPSRSCYLTLSHYIDVS